MAEGPRYRVKFRRRRDGKTDYRCRLKLLKSNLPRAVVRKTLNNITVQFAEYAPDGDKIICSGSGFELKKLGWKYSTANIPAAYLTGLLTGKRAVKNNIKNAVLDIGLQRPVKGSKVFASLKGMIDAGLSTPHDKDMLPSDDRVMGAHISKEIEKSFKDVKAKIMEA
ncbi:MAG: 50S ribosomal protein L18 [Thermoplasmatales archaeon]|nr:50S ribosomal protein L18 [Thermoplasmatales archaeon]